MSAWDHSVVCIVPTPLDAIATHVGRALDGDVGGAESFGIRASSTGDEPATHLVLATPCDADFAQAAPWLLDAETLRGTIQRDYAARWPDVAVPSLAKVQAFVDGCVLAVDDDLFSVLEANNLKIISTNEV